jgi:hypothetical protein
MLGSFAGCKKDSSEIKDPFEGEWYLKIKIGTTEHYLQLQSSGVYTGIGFSSSNVKSKIKFIKAEEGKYFITINNLANKVLDINQPVTYTFVVFTNKATPNAQGQLFTLEPVFNSTTSYYIKSGTKYLGAGQGFVGYYSSFSPNNTNPNQSCVWKLEHSKHHV